MPSGTSKGTLNKAKSRRSSKNGQRGKYVRQRTRTEARKKRRQAIHAARHPNDADARERCKLAGIRWDNIETL